MPSLAFVLPCAAVLLKDVAIIEIVLDLPSLQDPVVEWIVRKVHLPVVRAGRLAAKAAGVEGVTAHSGRVGLASELTAAGASTTETMLAGGWKTARMVAHYSAGASAERDAVAKYLHCAHAQANTSGTFSSMRTDGRDGVRMK